MENLYSSNFLIDIEKSGNIEGSSINSKKSYNLSQMH
jgi:hypothetical protein